MSRHKQGHFKSSWNCKTPTREVKSVLEDKRKLLREWEEQPIDVQAANAGYIAALHRRIRQIQVQLSHRRDAPV